MNQSGDLKDVSNTRKVQVYLKCLSGAKFEIQCGVILMPAAEYISLTLNKFNVNKIT